MIGKFVKGALAAASAAFFVLVNCPSAFAAVSIEPYICAQSGSVVRWVNVQGHNAIGMTLVHANDQGGGKFEGMSGIAANSTVSVIPITNTTSSNLSVQLMVKLTSGQIVGPLNPTSSSGGTYTWSLSSYGFKSNEQLAKMAVMVRNTTGRSGSIYLRHFVLNGTHLTNQILSTSGCLTY